MPYKNKIRCVYEIFSADNVCVYVGSTNNFYNRKRQHKGTCKNEKSHNYNAPLYLYMRENGGFDSFHFKILESVEDQNELHQKERDFIKLYAPLTNVYDVNVNARHSTQWQTAHTLRSRHNHWEDYKKRYKKYMYRKCVNPITKEVQTLNTVRAYLYKHKIKMSIKEFVFID